MKNTSWKATTGWSGILFVVLFVVSEAALSDTPGLGVEPSELRSWFEANATQIAWSTLGVAVAVGFFFLLFASGLRSHLESTGTASSVVWTRLSFASAVAVVSVAAAKAGIWPAISHHEVMASVSDGTIKVLGSIELFMLLTIVPMLLAAFLIGSSKVMFQGDTSSRRRGLLGFTAALFFVVGSFWIVTGEEESLLGVLVFMGYVGFLTWTTWTSINLIRTDSSTATREEVAAQ